MLLISVEERESNIAYSERIRIFLMIYVLIKVNKETVNIKLGLYALLQVINNMRHNSW